MTEFVFGRHAAKKTEYVLSKMKKALEAGRRVIIIVPEQQALVWDTLTCENLSPTDAFNVETVSFTRLADNVFRAFGGTACRYITDAEKTLLMWNAVVTCADIFRAFRSLDREDRYAPMFLRAVDELKLYSVTPAQLLDAADRLEGSGTLPDRLRDLAAVYSVYDRMLRTSFSDPAEIQDVLCDALRSGDYFSGCSVFIDSFYTLTPKELKTATEILRRCDDVTVTFAVSRDDRDRADCAFVWDYVKDMAGICRRLSIVPEIVDIASEKAPEFSYLAENLWNYSASPIEENTDRINIIKCTDRYDEASAAAARIKKLIAGGALYSDIAVVASDFNSLSGITDTELIRHGIPVYVAGKTQLPSQPAFKFLCAALSVIGGGWKRESLCAFLKTGLTGADPDMCDGFEKYTDIWNINGRKMYTDAVWGMNPDGYTESVSRWGEELISLANRAKDLIAPSLEAFGESFGGTVKDVCAASFKLLCDFDVYGQLVRQVEELQACGEFSASQEKSQVWNALCSLLDTVAGIIPDAKTDPMRFLSLIGKVAQTCNIGTIPDGIDRVTLGSVSGIRLDGIRHLIVLGATSGEFPAVPKEDGFFSDRDKILLEGAGITVSPTADHRITEELFRFRYALSAPEESLCVIIPSEDGDCRPSIGASALMRLFPGAEVFDLTTPAGKSAIERFAGMGCDAAGRPLSADRDAVGRGAADRFFGDALSMTQTKIETFNDCPFKFYGQYVLRLDEGKTAEINPADVGNFVHAILENFMREAAADGVFPISDDVIVSRSDRLIKDYISKVCPETVSSRRDWLFRRIHRSIRLFAQSLSDEFAQSRFTPYAFELSVGEDPRYLPTKAIPLSDGALMTLRGKIDRMDVLREDGRVYVRVADYKTNSKTFSKAEVMSGRNVQLLLYLFSICDSPVNCGFRKELTPGGEEILPAGAVYFAAHPGNTASDSPVDSSEARELALKDITRKGIVLDDIDVIEAMDRAVSGTYAPATLKEDGTFASKSSVESLDGFHAIEDAMCRSLAEIGDKILGGCAGSVPIPHHGQSPCRYCAMKAFCRHETRKEAEEDE